MTVFKTFLKVLKEYKFTVILYSVILIFFGIFNMSNSDSPMNFTSEKPNLYIVNEDENIGITNTLIKYLENTSNIIDLSNNEEKLDDALFYRDVNYIVYINKGFREDFLNGNLTKIEVKSTKDYHSSLAQINLKRFLNTASIYQSYGYSEEDIIHKLDEVIKENVNIAISTKLDTDNLTKVDSYYNFASYSLMAGAIQVICLVLSSFREKNVLKRTIISSTEYKKLNRKLLLSNSLFSLFLWLMYVAISIILSPNIMFSMHGVMFIINSFLFTICATTIAFLIGNLITDKNAVNGIVNCLALGSSFLCGAFIPQSWLPSGVLTYAHVLPTYYYVSNNEMIATLESFDINSLKLILTNMGIILIFSLVLFVITNIISRKKQRIA